MSRTYKDRPWALGGDRHRYRTSPNGHSAFKKACARSGRSKVKQALRAGQEPEPRYPVEKVYFD